MRACRAARAIRDAVHADNLRRRALGVDPVHVRIGVHSERAVFGNIGSHARFNYTVVGDAVNVASRVEELGRDLGTPESEVTIVISAATAQALPAEERPSRSAGFRSLRGRQAKLELFLL